MLIECFLDTNVLLYAAAGIQNDPEKFQIADSIIADKSFGLSTQVLGEFYVNCVRKETLKLSPMDIDEWIDVLAQFPLVELDATLVRTAIVLARRYQIHYYDAAIVAAAERLGAAILYTEDLNHGQRYGSVLVENPFRHS